MYGILMFHEQHYDNSAKEYKLAVVFPFPSSAGEVHSDHLSFSVCLRNSGEGKIAQAEGIFLLYNFARLQLFMLKISAVWYLILETFFFNRRLIQFLSYRCLAETLSN